MVNCRPVESEDFMSSNKNWKTILCTMKLEKITSRLDLRIELKIYLFKPEKIYCKNIFFQVGAEIIFYANIFINLYCKIRGG